MPATGPIPLQTVIPGQLITSALWNAEYANIYNLFTPAGLDTYSGSDAQMQLQTNPYPGSVTSHATSTGGEIERIRYALAQIIGTTYWYQPAPSGNSLSNIFITGEIRGLAMSTVPTGFLSCDGSAVSRTTYAALFAAIGTTWGVGDNSTTFNVPDLRGRTPIGLGTGSGLTARSVGQSGGEETHVLTTSELASHSHTITDPGHVHTITDPGHVHLETTILTGGGSTKMPENRSDGSSAQTTGQNTVSSVTGITGANSNTTGISSTNANGSGTAHNNMQPWACVNYVIKT